MSHGCQCFWNCYKTFAFFSLLAGCRIPCVCHTKRRFNVQKLREHVVLWANVLCGHFFDITILQSAPKLVCFVHFDFEMCFAPQRRALFGHLNFQKCCEPGVPCKFWLGNVLRATVACPFSTSNPPKVLRSRSEAGVFCTLLGLDLPTYGRIERLNSPKSYSWYVTALFPIGMALLPVFSPVFCFQNMEPHIQVGVCLTARSQFFCKFTRFLDLRAFASFCGRFADFCGRFAGNFGRSFVHLYALVLGIWEWYAARTQAMFSHIPNVNCGDSVATRKQKQAN